MYEGEMQKRLGRRYPIHLTLSNINPRFRNSVEAKNNFFSLCYDILFYLCSILFSLVRSQLFFQIVFLNDFGSRRKRVEKQCC